MGETNEKIEIYSDGWYRRAYQIALDFAPKIYPCKKCNNPVASGYCCTFCGDTNPSSSKVDTD